MRERDIADISTVDVPVRHGERENARLVPALTVISHPVLERAGERFLLEELAHGREVALSRNAPDFMRPGGGLARPLSDPCLSRKPLRLLPAAGGRIRLDASEGSTVVLSGEPLRGVRELGPEALARGVPLELAGRVVLLLHLAEAGAGRVPDAMGMVGDSAALQQVRRHIERVVDLEVPVLVRGETGSGKELIARALHQHSRRRERAFVSVNLGALPRELAASELFGARRGAFTGAVRDQQGFFQAAHGGTLFLDEVGEAPAELQVMLLRALETGEVFPVGSSTPVKVDVRLVAATDAHLEEQVRQGHFKAPLLHRLAGFTLRIPPLRERREDIGPLFHHFARQALEAQGEAHRLSPEDAFAEPWLLAPLASRLVRHDWPGNVRQLRNVVQQLVIANRGQPSLRPDPQLEQELGPSPADVLPPGPVTPVTPAMAGPSPRAPGVARRRPSEIAESELLAALRACDWELKPAADLLGIPRPSIYDLVDRHPGIRTAGKLSREEILRCHQECRGDLDAMARRLEVSRHALARRVKELGLGAKEG